MAIPANVSKDPVKEAVAKGIQDTLISGISLPPSRDPLCNKYGQEVDKIEVSGYDWLNTHIRVTFQGEGSAPQYFHVRVSEQY